MSKRTAVRVCLVTLLACIGGGCASTRTTAPDVAWGSVAGPMCSVRVESAYDVSIEAAASAGAHRVDLGRLAPDEAAEFAVPCEHGAVTVFRVVRNGDTAESRLGIQSRALDSDDVTVVSLRPAATRHSVARRR